MNADVADFVATGELGAVWAQADASDRIDYIHDVEGIVVSSFDRGAILVAIQGIRLEVVKWCLCLLLLSRVCL